MISMADTFAGSSPHILNKNNGKNQIYLFVDFQHIIKDLEVQKSSYCYKYDFSHSLVTCPDYKNHTLNMLI